MIGSFTHTQIRIWDTDDRNEYGEPNAAEPAIYQARIQPYTANTIGMDGNNTQPSYAVYFEASEPVSPRCSIEIDGILPRDTPVIAVSNYRDGRGRYRYTRVIC